MERSGAKFDDLRRTIDRLSSQRVHIVGDTIVDSYTQCAMIGGLTKTPTMSVLFESRKRLCRRRGHRRQALPCRRRCGGILDGARRGCARRFRGR